jgi:acetolactate synthase-1/3 small subunit
MPRRVLSVLVRDRIRVLARVSSLIGRRGYNIESLAVAPAETPGLSRMTISIDADEGGLEQVRKQILKLIDVSAAAILDPEASVSCELALAKVAVGAEERREVLKVAEAFGARVVDADASSMTLELAGERRLIESFLEMIAKHGIIELARSGASALGCGAAALSEGAEAPARTAAGPSFALTA